MSKSRSLTPTNSLSLSRKSTQARQRRPTGSSASEGNPPTRPQATGSLVISEPGPSKRKRSTSVSDTETQSKRARLSETPPSGSQIMRPSPSSSSNEGSEDTEMRIHREEASPTPQPQAPPEKKKRTRTLTTPHQAAVLHALWAQSQFPTTAMREEVGRSIGLSARKVQIWFQNQRQKMRRPKSHVEVNAESAARPATASSRHGAASDPGSAVPMQRTPPRSAGGTTSLPMIVSGESQYPASSSFHGSFEAIPRLQGPGVPGPPHSLGYSDVSPQPSSGHSGYSSAEGVSPTAPIFAHSLPTSQSSTLRRDPSRILPPLGYGRPGSSQRSSLSSASISSTLVSPTNLSTAEHDQPRISPTSTLLLPPPFALEPPPQWDTSTFSPRPSTSFSESSGRGAYSPEAQRSEHDSTGEDSDQDPPRSGRYDPVRDGFVRAPSHDEQQHDSNSP